MSEASLLSNFTGFVLGVWFIH